MYLIPLLSTLMSSVFCAALPIVSRNIGHRGVAVFSITSLTIAFLSSAVIWFDLYIGSSPVWLDLFGPWFEVGTVTVSWVFYYDLLTAHMLFTVTSVSLAVHIYAVVYMRSDPHLSLFMSYLSLFTFFMLVYVCGDNLIVMLVGWWNCPSGDCDFLVTKLFLLMNRELNNNNCTCFKREFYTKGIKGLKRIGPHSALMNDILTGGLLGDGTLEKRLNGCRFRITFISKFKDVADFYLSSFYNLGYSNTKELGDPKLYRSINRPNNQFTYCVSTYSYSSFIYYYNEWYYYDKNNSSKRIKKLPTNILTSLTPLAIALWVMGDGCWKNGAFIFCSESFTKEENLLLCKYLYDLYGIEAHIQKRGVKGYRIFVNKKNVIVLKKLINPYLKESCYYKFRCVKQKW